MFQIKDTEHSITSLHFFHHMMLRLTVIFLLKRSPNLNPAETRVNRNLKKDVCANHNYGTEENLTNAVTRYLR